MTTLRHLLARSAITFCVLLPWLAPELRAEDPPTGVIVDDQDGLVPLGGSVLFELQVQLSSGDQTGEYPEAVPVIEWSFDQQVWMDPSTHPDHFENPPATSRFLPRPYELTQPGDITVYARLAIHQWNPYTRTTETVVVGTYSHAVRIVGVESLQYSLDGGETWVEAPTNGARLVVASLALVDFRAVPSGADTFPAEQPVWSSEVQGVGIETVSLSTETWAVVRVNCGLSERSIGVDPLAVGDYTVAPVEGSDYVFKDHTITLKLLKNEGGTVTPVPANWTASSSTVSFVGSTAGQSQVVVRGDVFSIATMDTTITATPTGGGSALSFPITVVGFGRFRYKWSGSGDAWDPPSMDYEGGGVGETIVLGADAYPDFPVGATVTFGMYFLPQGWQPPPQALTWTNHDTGDADVQRDATFSFPTVSQDSNDRIEISLECAGIAGPSAHVLRYGLEKLRWKREGGTYADVDDGCITAAVGETLSFEVVTTPGTRDTSTVSWTLSGRHPYHYFYSPAIENGSPTDITFTDACGSPANPECWQIVTATFGPGAAGGAGTATARVAVIGGDPKIVPDWPSVAPGETIGLRFVRAHDGELEDVVADWSLVPEQSDGVGTLTVPGGGSASFAYLTGGTGDSDDGFICVKAVKHQEEPNPPEDTASIPNVKIAKLQYRTAADGAWVDAPATPVPVPVSSFLQVQAIPAPEATWPKNKPVWSAAGVTLETPEEAGPALRSVAIPSTPGTYSVTATCGTSSKTMQIRAFTVTLDMCAANWYPKGGNEDNSTTIHAYVTPDTVKGTFEFRLFDVSSEPGYCMNMPVEYVSPVDAEDGSVWEDLQFDSSQSGFTIPAYTDGTRSLASTSSDELSEATVVINSYDYGAYGKIKVTFTAKVGGNSSEGKNGSVTYATIPRDTDGNHIPDSAQQNTGPVVDGSATNAADDDNEHTGETPARMIGDGFTRYQEWRGFMIGGTHVRTSVTCRDVMVYDRDELGVGCYTAVTGINAYRIRSEEMVSTTRVVTHNRETARGVAQCAIVMWAAVVDGTPYGTAHNLGTPANSGPIYIDMPQIQGYHYAFQEAFVDLAIAHEMGHCSALIHHQPTTTSGNPCMMRYLVDPVTEEKVTTESTICTDGANCMRNIDVKDE